MGGASVFFGKAPQKGGGLAFVGFTHFPSSWT